MKPIEETHPSLKKKISLFGDKEVIMHGWSCCSTLDVQKHTVDKAVLKEEFAKITKILSCINIGQETWKQIDNFNQELGLEDEIIMDNGNKIKVIPGKERVRGFNKKIGLEDKK